MRRFLSGRLMLLPFLLLIGYYLLRIFRQFRTFNNVPGTLLAPYVTSGFERTSGRLENFRHDIFGLDQEDSSLVEQIRAFWIKRPTSDPLNLKHPNWVHFAPQSKKVDELVGYRDHGFFVEVGAADGERASNSLYFEKERGWGGLLIEANPDFFMDLVGKNRKAYAVTACASPVPHSTMLNFKMASAHSGLAQYMEDTHAQWLEQNYKGNSTIIQVPCFPLLSILLALNVTHMDYFSLDVSGAELGILDTIPFERITFDVMTVAYRVKDCKECTDRKIKALTELVSGSGQYKLVAHNYWDLFFVRSVPSWYAATSFARALAEMTSPFISIRTVTAAGKYS